MLKIISSRLFPYHQEPVDSNLSAFPSLPSHAVIEPTMRCNLTCDFCYQNALRSEGFLKDMPIEHWRRVLENITPEVRSVTLIGGEVFAYKNIFEIFDLLCEFGIKFRITTNATLISQEKAKRLLSYQENLVGIGVSIDGEEHFHDSIRGKGMFKKSVDAMRKLSDNFPIFVNMVIMSNNIESAKSVMIYLHQEASIHHMSFQFVQYATQSEIDLTRQIIGDPRVHLDTTIVPEGTRRLESVNQVSQWMESLRVTAERLGIKVHFEPRIAETHLVDFWKESLKESDVPLQCTGANVPRINYLGELNFCTYIRPNLGSLLNTHLRKLWHSKEMLRYRDLIAHSRQMLPICERCCRCTLKS